MNVPDAVKQAQPLLDFGILILPSHIDDDHYADLTAAFAWGRAMFPDRFLGLRCHAWGGATDVVLALCDLVAQDGLIAGLALGSCDSGAAILWAACPQRYYYPRSRLLIHGAANGEMLPRWPREEFENKSAQMIVEDKRQAEIFARASNEKLTYWQNLIHDGGEVGYALYPHDLARLEMGFPIEDAPEYLKTPRLDRLIVQQGDASIIVEHIVS